MTELREETLPCFLNRVEALGIESEDTCVRNVVDRRLDDANETTNDDERRRGVSASGTASMDGAIRLAAKLAIDAGDLDRARRLLDLLDAKPRPASLLALARTK